MGANSICALKGSSVDLHCSAQRPKSSMKWFTVRWEGNKKVQDQIFADGKLVKISEDSNFTVTMNDLRESDKNTYCCSYVTDKRNKCQGGEIQLLVAGTVVQLLMINLCLQKYHQCINSCFIQHHLRPAGEGVSCHRRKDSVPDVQQQLSSD